jgi:SNF2 family DNA or RNA helicase
MRQTLVPRGYQSLITGHQLTLQREMTAAGMGLGKTVSTYNTLDIEFIAGEDAPVLILAPLRVARSTWPEEALKWDHLRHIDVMPIVGTEKERLHALRHDASVFTCNYDNLVWLVEHFGERWPFRTVVLDESTRVKGFRLRQGTKRAHALAKVAHTKVKKIHLLTGTPAPNGLADLWGQMWFVDAGQRLGRTYSGFRDRWFQKSFDVYGHVPLSHSQLEIQDKLRDVMLSVDAADWFDLDAPIVNNIYVDLPPKARQLYKDMEKQMFMELEGCEVEAFNAASRTMKCLQIANGAAYIDDKQNWKGIHDEKILALEDVVEEAAGAPVLVAYHFKSDLVRLLRAFPQGRSLDAAPATLREWNEGRIPVLFAHPQSAGHGLNMQHGGNILVFFAHNWNLEDRLQILERIGPVRQMQAGYRRPVFIHNIIARDTVDEMVMERVETKKEVQDILLNAMKRRR